MWTVEIVRKSFPRRFLAAKLTRVPVLGRLLERAFFEGDDLILLPAEKTLVLNEKVADPENLVVPSKVLDHFIDRAGFLWIMNTCICRESMGCESYPVELGCLFMGEAARGINPSMGRSVTPDEARAHVARCREAGLFHLVGRNKMDTVWLGVRPGGRLLTVCNCCGCCCLWKILPDVSGFIGEKLRKMPGVSVTVTEACAGCGTCVEGRCIAGAITVVEGRARIGEECRGCGTCAERCPEGAIRVLFESADSIEASISRLSGSVDVT